VTRFTPLWLQAGSYAASVDRRLIGALYPDARSSGCQVSAVGAMDLAVAPGSVAVPLMGGVGSVLCVSDGTETVTLPAAPASGLERTDLVICQARGADIDGGASDDFLFTSVQGNPVAPPSAIPALPANAAVLAGVTVRGGSAAIAPADVGDWRPGNLAVPPGYAPAYPSKPPPLVGYLDFYQGSKNAGTYDSTPKALPVPAVDSTCVLNTGGTHGFGAANGSSAHEYRRSDNNAAVVPSTGTIQVVAGSTYALPAIYGVFDIAANQALSLYVHYTINSTNNYFAPKVGYVITPK
jgi:hypothetical protein